MNTRQIISATFLLILPLVSNAAVFSVENIPLYSNEYSTTVNGVTMTIDSPAPSSLAESDGSVNGLSSSLYVGQLSFTGLRLTSFDIRFDQTVSVESFTSLGTWITGEVAFSIAGEGAYSEGIVPVKFGAEGEATQEIEINGGPLIFLADQRYTFSDTTAGGDRSFVLGAITTSAVPIPAAAWLFGSALIGLVGLKRKQ